MLTRARSFIGYPRILASRYNPTHAALATLMHTGHISHLITQNVDGLHLDALNHHQSPQVRDKSNDLNRWEDRILELHGTLHRVHCRSRHTTPRQEYQQHLGSHNPYWNSLLNEFERTGTQPRTNPDGDVELEGVSFEDFVVPSCEFCSQEGRVETIMKPDVVFFGESISQTTKDRSFQFVESGDRFLIIGTTLTTYSAFRLLKHALEIHKPALMLNVGPTRGDGIPGVEKLELESGLVLLDVVRLLVGGRLAEDPHLQMIFSSGVITPIPDQ